MLFKKCFLPKYLGNFHRHFQTSSIVCKEKRWKEKSALPFQSELKNPVAEVYSVIEAWPADKFGAVNDIKPAKITVEKNHVYEWCGCGRSHSQPFCDTTCENLYWKKNIVGGKISYIAPKSGDIWFCLCKHTKNRPFCDGSHRNEEITSQQILSKLELFEPFPKKMQ